MVVMYRGDKSGQEYKDLWNLAVSTDLTLEREYRDHGFQGVVWALNTDDRLEHWLSRLGAQVTFIRTGDRSVLNAVQSANAPGDGDLLPTWSLEAARAQNKSEFQARQRCSAGRGAAASVSDTYSGGDGAASGERRPRRRAKAGGTTFTTSSPSTPAAGAGRGAQQPAAPPKKQP